MHSQILGQKNSKSGIIYETVNQNVEQCSKIIDFVTAKLTPVLFTVPSLFLTAYAYSAGNLNEENIRLAFPFW